MSNAETMVTIYHPDQEKDDRPADRAITSMQAFIEIYEPKGFVIDQTQSPGLGSVVVNRSPGIPAPAEDLNIQPYEGDGEVIPFEEAAQAEQPPVSEPTPAKATRKVVQPEAPQA